MAHQSWDNREILDGECECVSHNYPWIAGRGANAKQAFDAMSNQLDDLFASQPERMRRTVEDRIAKGLLCECGVPLDGPPISWVTKRPAFPQGRIES